MSEDLDDKKKNNVAFRDVMRFAVNYWRPGWKLGLLSALLMLLAVTADSILPVYTARLIDAMTGGVEKDAATSAAWSAFIGFAVCSLLQPALRVASLFVWNGFAVDNLYRIVTEGLRKVHTFGADWHANTFAGGTVRKLTRGMWAFDSFEDTILMGLLPAVTCMVSITTVLILNLPQVGFATVFMILAYCAFSIWISVKVLAPRFRKSAETDTKVGATLADIITGNPTVKTFGTEDRENILFETVAKEWKAKSYHAWQYGVSADAARSLFRLFMTASMVAVAITMWASGEATPGDIVLVITTFFIISGYLRDIGMHISHAQRAISDMEDIISFWMREDEVRDVANAANLKIKSGKRDDLIVFDRVSFSYPGKDRVIYDDLSVSIATGERLALVGPSGSGKSTFVKLLQRLYNLNGGQIVIDGEDIAGVTMQSLRQAISLVPQDPILFHRSLSENIAYGRPDATQDEIIEAAKKAFAHDFITTLPKGYDTLVGERGIKLSGGERQRVAIARAILANAPILIMDEATSSLDSISEDYIQKGLQVLMEGRTTITIAHRLSTIRAADRILVFDQGKIVEQGSHAVLMSNPASRYKALYDMQALQLLPDEEEKVA